MNDFSEKSEHLPPDLKYLIIIWGLFFLALIPNYAHYGYMIVDCGREAYYPTQILLGKVLYKDIFNIYGPLSYMFNAVLFKIFGINLNVLYLSGCVCAFSILSLTYLIARKFFGEFLSFSICAFTIIIGVMNLNLFCFIFPYSYGMLYGTVTVLISIWLLLKYEQEPEKNLYLYLSGFFAGICVANKYEFLPYFLVIAYAAFKIKPLNFKQYGILLTSLISVPVSCFGILFLQGLRVNDLITTAIIINKMAHTKTLNYFYQHVGTFFNKQTIPFLLTEFSKTLIIMALLFYSTIVKRRILSIILIFVVAFLIINYLNVTSFSFLPVLISLWFVFNFKNIRNNPKLMILTLSSILLTLKVYWGLVVVGYGTYLASLSLITIIALIFDKFKDKKINPVNSDVRCQTSPPANPQPARFSHFLGRIRKSLDFPKIGLFPHAPLIISFYLIMASITLCLYVAPDIIHRNKPLSTSRGKIYPERFLAKSTDKLIKYIQSNTKKTDTIVIFPEGLLINFLTDRKSDNYYNSLIPLYVETFGEDDIIEHFKKTKPEYIIFNSWNNEEYYFKYICNDYALSFCDFVAKNYTKEKLIDEGFRYLIFKRR